MQDITNPYNNVLSKITNLVPAQLMTCTFVDFDTQESFRTFTTMSDFFPIHGRKKMYPNSHWDKIIFKKKQCFSINRVRDYPEHFFDWKLIEKAGLCSALCVPIMSKNKVIGTVNLLDTEGAYKNAPEQILIDIVSQLSSLYEGALQCSKG